MCGRIDSVSMMAAAILFALIAASDSSRGIAMYRQRQFEAAEAEFRRVLVRSPRDTTARLYLARTLVELRRIPEALAEVERHHIERTLRAHGGNRTRAALELGISRATLINKIKSYGLNL